MSKKRFVQQIVIRSLPKAQELGSAIEYAEQLWNGLTQAGYGQAQQNGPHESTDWYRKLSDRQRRWFTGFWKAFNYKQDRNGAAMRWYQLGELSDQEYQFIIEAATQEARKPRPEGQARKMAQGWLHEQRYNDYQPTEKNENLQKQHVLTRLNNELNGLKRLYEAGGDEALIGQIEQLEEQIWKARTESHEESQKQGERA